MKYIDLSGIDLGWHKIGTCPFKSTYGGAIGRPSVCIVNGLFSILYACGTNTNPTGYMGAVLYSWNKEGEMCTYQTASFVNNSPISTLVDGNAVYQNGNEIVFSYHDGGIWEMVIPTDFIPGGIVNLPDKQLETFSPCGVRDFLGNIYCPEQGYYCQEFIQDFPESSNYWASIFDANRNLIGGGFIGNAPQNPFNRMQTNLPPFVFGNDVYYKNGFSIFGNFGSSGSPFQVFGWNQAFLSGDPSTLVCGASNDTVYVIGINNFQVYPSRDYGIPPFSEDSLQLSLGACDLNGAFAFPDNGNNRLLSKDYVVSLNSIGDAGFALLRQQNYFYCQVDTSGLGHYAGDIYISGRTFDSLDIPTQPVAVIKNQNGLINFHRPISPKGSFLA